MTTAAFVVVVASALVPQVLFSLLYWKWVPGWIWNPYGRLAQLGSLCHILILSFYLYLAFFGRHANQYVVSIVFILAFTLLTFFGFLQLTLLRRAVKDGLAEEEREKQNGNAS